MVNTGEYITAVEALAETLQLLRDNLLKRGFSKRETRQLCNTYIVALMQKPIEIKEVE